MADPIVIEQIETRGSEALRLELEASALPDKGMRTGDRLETSTRWAPGALEPKWQILSVQLKPFTMSGRWDDDALGEGGAAVTLYATARQMQREGLRVSLTWGNILDRVGLITDLDADWEGPGLLSWSLEFTPHEGEDPRDTARAARRQATSRAALDAAAQASIARCATIATAQATAEAAAWLKVLA